MSGVCLLNVPFFSSSLSPGSEERAAGRLASRGAQPPRAPARSPGGRAVQARVGGRVVRGKVARGRAAIAKIAGFNGILVHAISR